MDYAQRLWGNGSIAIFTPAICLVALAPLGLSHRLELYYSLLRLAGYLYGLVSQNHRLALQSPFASTGN